MDGPPPPEEDFSTLPISERLTHKNWKARVSAYEALVKTFQTTASDNDPAFKPYLNNSDLLKKIATDANAVAQEKGLECLLALVKFAGENAAKTREVVIPALVDKSFGSSRAGTKANAVELSLQYTEIENTGTGVVNDLMSGLSAKQPKTVSGCVLALREIIRIFGIQTTPPPPILKALPKIFSHTDKTVRAEGTSLAQALYQYIGAGIDPWLAELKPVQVKELKESFDVLEKDGKGKGSLKPERMTRAHAREVETAVEAGDDGGEEEAEAEEVVMDPRQFAEPVDVVSKLPSTLQAALSSSKWKERKEVLDEVATILSAAPRIREASELGDLAKSLATRIQSDANINCVMTAAVCMEHLAKGLMASFAKYHEAVVPPMLERLKERKANVTDTIGSALDAIFATTTLADIVPDLGSALSSKNPQVKEGTLKFLGRAIATATVPIQPAQIKPLSETLIVLLEDSFEGARNEAALCLGTLMKMVGERPLNAVIESVADVRKAKIKEAYEKATVKCKAGAGPSKPPPKAAPPPSGPQKKKATPKPSAPPQEEAPLPAKKLAAKPPAKASRPQGGATTNGSSGTAPAGPPTAKKVTVITVKPSKPPPPSAPGSLDTFKYKHNPEDAEALAADLVPTSMLVDLADANWKTRIAALDEMATWVDGVIDDLDAEVLIRSLAKKGWSEKNFQVSAKIFGICATLAERCPSFGRPCVALCVGHMSEKLGDLKLKKPAGDALIAFAERTSLQFVLNQAYEPLSKQKAPKVLADATAWMNSALTEFGIAGLSLRSLIDFLKTALANSNAAVRTSATKTLVTVKLFAGPSIKDLVQDLNPQLLTTITTEFDKSEGIEAPEPTRFSADVVVVAATTVNGAASGGAGGDALDDLFPRVELDGLLKGTTILADAKSDAWKTKKEALENLQATLDQGPNKRLKPTMGEISQVLKARVTDTNKAVQTLALDVVARIATGMGKPFEKYNRFFVQPISTVLSDQKAPIRNAALVTLTAIATACEGIESMVAGIHAGLETANPVQKGALLNWLNEWFKSNPPLASLDLSTWASPIVTSLDDRSADVRKSAVALIPVLIICAGYDYVLQQANSLKPASRGSAVQHIQTARQNAAPLPKPAAKVSKAPAMAAAAAPSPSPPPESPPPTASAVSSKLGSKLGGVRRKLPQGPNRPESRSDALPEPTVSRSVKPGVAMKKPGASATQPKVGASDGASSGLPLFGTNLDARKARCGKDVQKWVNESGPTRKDLAESLQSQMEPHASKELVSRLFSHDHNAVGEHIAGITTLCEFYNSAQSSEGSVETICLAMFDLPLKYASIKVHEPQPNLISKCLELVETVLAFLRSISHQLSDNEALCFIPTIIYKLGDAREQVRIRVQQILQTLPKVYAYSRVFQLLLDYGLKSKVAKTRQGTLDEMAGILKKSGMTACEPNKAFPVLAAMISDKDSTVRKAALNVISEGYMLIGEKVWSFVGPLPPKDKTQLEERLRRVAGPSSHDSTESIPPPQLARLTGLPRPGSPASGSRIGGLPRPASPAAAASRMPRPGSPATGSRIGGLHRPASPSSKRARPPSPSRQRPLSPPTTTTYRAASPSRLTRSTQPMMPSSPTGIGRPRTMLPSRLGRPRSHFTQPIANEEPPDHYEMDDPPARNQPHERVPSVSEEPADITVTISTILSSDASRSVDALKKVQRILAAGADGGAQYRELAEHAEGLVETITLQMAHVFERPEELLQDDNFRLAKHLIQTLNNFCDHALLAESLTVDIVTSLLEELTLRLLETDDSAVKKVKDLSRFINMIILRLFATGRRMSIFKSLFVLLLQVVKPFPSNGTAPDSREAKVAELVLKCIWKLARGIPQDLEEQKLDPVELFPAIEHFLQSVPPNEWRARATNKVPCGDMPLRTIKVIIQHVVAHHGDDVYDLLSASFDDPSATIVYPYVYRILNAAPKADPVPRTPDADVEGDGVRPLSAVSSRPMSPHETASEATSPRNSSAPSHRTSPSVSSLNGGGAPTTSEEPDPDAQLLLIIGHISSETTGALHKEGITELHHFLKAHPSKKPRVEKMLESTGAAFRKYINRALATRAAEDKERDFAVSEAFDKLDNRRQRDAQEAPLARQSLEASPRSPTSPARSQASDRPDSQDRLSRLHDLFQYRSSADSARITPSGTRSSLSES